MNDLIKLRGSRGGYNPRWLDGKFIPSDPFRFVEESARENLMDTGHFRVVEGDRLSASLDGDIGNVVELIESGECDGILDFLLYAERRHENRSPVLSAIVERSEVLRYDEDDEDGSPTVSAAEVRTAR
jgi:hypothetical protein